MKRLNEPTVLSDQIISDPSCSDGEDILYECSQDFNFLVQENNEMIKKPIIVKILTKKDESGKLCSVRIEILMKNDLFSIFQSSFTTDSYLTYQGKEELKIGIEDFPNVVKSILEKNGTIYNSKFIICPDETYQLCVEMPLDFKNVTILRIDFENAEQSYINAQVKYRNTIVQKKLEQIRKETSNLISVLKIKDTSLLNSLKNYRK